MKKIIKSGGQTLVETAIVLPVVCLAIVVTVQIIASCHNAVLLQFMAFETSRALSSETSPTSLLLSWPKLWGRGASPLRHQSSEIPNPWRSFSAPSRVTDPGYVASVDLESLLLPTGGFGKDLPILDQHATAEALVEPRVPEEE